MRDRTLERRGHRFRLRDDGFRAVEREIIDDVDQQERRPRHRNNDWRKTRAGMRLPAVNC